MGHVGVLRQRWGSVSSDRFGIVGKVVARTYQVEEVVAEGGFGVVYRAHHKGFRATVALKCLKIPSDLDESQRRQFLEQFRSEAEVLFRLASSIPHIARPLHVDAFSTEDGRLVPFLALEWLEGRTLDGMILRRAESGRPPLELAKLVRLLSPVATALELAHHLPGPHGPVVVVHRDIKPDNLFIARVGNEDHAKILDFGISKVKSAAGQLAGKASVTGDEYIAFSPAYAAPEQWAPRRFGQTGRWTDVWGLGLTIVEAAKGSEVILGDHAEMMGTILDPVRRPTPRGEGIVVSDQVEKVFLRALALDPKDRYQTVSAFWDDLVKALGLSQELSLISLTGRAASGVQGGAVSGLDSVFPPPERAQRGPNPGASAPTQLAESPRVAPAARPALPSVQIRPEPAIASASPSPRARPAIHSSPNQHWFRDLSPAFSLLVLSIALRVLDRFWASQTGAGLSLGPWKLSWLAAGVMVLALLRGISAVKRMM